MQQWIIPDHLPADVTLSILDAITTDDLLDVAGMSPATWADALASLDAPTYPDGIVRLFGLPS